MPLNNGIAEYARTTGCAAVVALALTTSAIGRGGQQPGGQTTLPGGASQLQETHGDWRVNCAQQGDKKVCAFSQQQADKDSRQLIVGVELKTTDKDSATGTIVLPFGLAVSRPVTLQVDDGPAKTTSFRTCIPAGCLVGVTFDPAAIAALRNGASLTVKTAADSGQETAFKISLKGFGSALDRTASLSK